MYYKILLIYLLPISPNDNLAKYEIIEPHTLLPSKLPSRLMLTAGFWDKMTNKTIRKGFSLSLLSCPYSTKLGLQFYFLKQGLRFLLLPIQVHVFLLFRADSPGFISINRIHSGSRPSRFSLYSHFLILSHCMWVYRIIFQILKCAHFPPFMMHGAINSVYSLTF